MTLRLRRSAASLVEAALVTPVLVALLMLAAGASQAYRTQMVVDAAAAEGARYATLHPDATAEQVVSWARAQAGDPAGDALAVSVSTSPMADQDYVMSVVDLDGVRRTADARTTRESVMVTASVPVSLWGAVPYTAAASHSGVRSTEGVAR